jgi:hypothetical protein
LASLLDGLIVPTPAMISNGQKSGVSTKAMPVASIIAAAISSSRRWR